MISITEKNNKIHIIQDSEENEAIEIIKTLKMFIKGEEDEKIYNKFFRR